MTDRAKEKIAQNNIDIAEQEATGVSHYTLLRTPQGDKITSTGDRKKSNLK